MTSAFSWHNSISLCPASFCTPRPNLPVAAAAAAKSLQSCPTLCDPIDGSPPGYPVPGILQARTLEWVVQCMKVKVKVKSLSRVQLLVTPWTAAYQAPLSMGFSRHEYWSGSEKAMATQFACYPRYFLTSYFYIQVPYNEKDIFFGC